MPEAKGTATGMVRLGGVGFAGLPARLSRSLLCLASSADAGPTFSEDSPRARRPYSLLDAAWRWEVHMMPSKI
ncbi:hypothetical protein MRB53_023109 [Persea americana]|uniref:Uncharacterized protein n=1 Tax=Persea americana TaxID=3435 RepID=A0ACC2L8H2_PERAE|nr:hypothetical protein MRB53_023109 [Persea americana]